MFGQFRVASHFLRRLFPLFYPSILKNLVREVEGSAVPEQDDHHT